MILILLALTALLIYGYIKYAKTYWQRRGVELFKGIESGSKRRIEDWYNYFKSKNVKGGGVMAFTKPVFVPVDREVLRSIMVKDFDHFVNHNSYINEKMDPLTGHLLNLKDDKWRNLRKMLTPTFTSGKMKMMFQTMLACTDELVNILNRSSKIGDPVDIKDILARFTTDIIGSVAFGIECNSLKDPENEFRKYGRMLTKTSWKLRLPMLLPHELLKMIGYKRHDSEMEAFFINVTKNIVAHRETNNIYRKDFMHLMLQLKNRGKVSDDEKILDENTKGEHMKITEIAAQLFVFFVAGFETSSITMSFALLELAQSQEIQDKLRKEMVEVLKKHGGFTYEAVMDMEYLDQVVNETLRLHPPAFATGRICNETFKVPESNIVIEKGVDVIIPILGLHHDPEFYPEPFKFQPERFSAENKKSRDPITFMPFGGGPRNCIGSRFGLLQTKVGLTAILTNFKVTLNHKTQTPIEYDPKAFLLAVKGDLWLNFTKL